MARRSSKEKIRPATWEKWDKASVWHPFTPQSVWEKDPMLVIESGKGIYIKDVRGRKYIDGVSSLWVNLFGHRHPVLDRALRTQAKKIAHSTFLGLSHPPAIRLARRLTALAPRGLTRVFYSDNGSTAVEVALKMAYQYWDQNKGRGAAPRDEFLALEGSYHGDTLGSVSVGGIGLFHKKFGPLLFKTRFAMAPQCFRCPYNFKKNRHRYRCGEKVREVGKPGKYRAETGCRWECLRSVESILKKRGRRLAGAVIEPINQGAAGMNVLPPGYTAGFQRLVRRYGTLLIADEVATGFGRTGTLFASEQEGLRPDFLCLSKSITGGYLPLAATLARESIYRGFKGPAHKYRTFFHGHTYTANPLAAAVANANLDLLKSTKLLENTRFRAHLLKDELKRLEALPGVGSIRQAGLMAGVELVQNTQSGQPFSAKKRMAARVCRRLLKKGIWMRPLGDVVIFMPPPVIPNRELRRMVRVVAEVIRNEVKT